MLDDVRDTLHAGLRAFQRPQSSTGVSTGWRARCGSSHRQVLLCFPCHALQRTSGAKESPACRPPRRWKPRRLRPITPSAPRSVLCRWESEALSDSRPFAMKGAYSVPAGSPTARRHSARRYRAAVSSGSHGGPAYDPSVCSASSTSRGAAGGPA